MTKIPSSTKIAKYQNPFKYQIPKYLPCLCLHKHGIHVCTGCVCVCVCVLTMPVYIRWRAYAVCLCCYFAAESHVYVRWRAFADVHMLRVYVAVSISYLHAVSISMLNPTVRGPRAKIIGTNWGWRRRSGSDHVPLQNSPESSKTPAPGLSEKWFSRSWLPFSSSAPRSPTTKWCLWRTLSVRIYILIWEHFLFVYISLLFFLRPRFCASGPGSPLYGACGEPFLFVCVLIYVYRLIYEYIWI
jgi:hypothetical protein